MISNTYRTCIFYLSSKIFRKNKGKYKTAGAYRFLVTVEMDFLGHGDGDSSVGDSSAELFAVGSGVKAHLMWTPWTVQSGRALWAGARSHGSEIMTGDKLETNHLGLKLALGLLYPSVRLSLEAPGLPLSTAERSTSGVKPNLDTWCAPAEFALLSLDLQLMCVKDEDGLVI